MRLKAFLTILFTLAIPLELSAHHSVMRAYDTQQEIRIQGKILATEWRNPHSRIVLSVRNEMGEIERWTVETNAMETIDRLGPATGFYRADFVVGDSVTVGGWKGRQGKRIFLTWVTFKGGDRVYWRDSPKSAAENQ